METDLSTLSGGLMLKGVLAIIFGIAAVFWPGITLLTLLYIFSAYLLVNGLVDLVQGIVRFGGAGPSLWHRILPLLYGAIQIGVGVYLLRHPHVTFATFILLIGFTLIVRGVFEVVEGLFEGAESALYRTAMVLVGVLAVVAGVVMLFQPKASGVAFVWILGLYALITGPLLIASAMDFNRLQRDASVGRTARANR